MCALGFGALMGGSSGVGRSVLCARSSSGEGYPRVICKKMTRRVSIPSTTYMSQGHLSGHLRDTLRSSLRTTQTHVSTHDYMSQGHLVHLIHLISIRGGSDLGTKIIFVGKRVDEVDEVSRNGTSPRNRSVFFRDTSRPVRRTEAGRPASAAAPSAFLPL